MYRKAWLFALADMAFVLLIATSVTTKFSGAISLGEVSFPIAPAKSSSGTDMIVGWVFTVREAIESNSLPYAIIELSTRVNPETGKELVASCVFDEFDLSGLSDAVRRFRKEYPSVKLAFHAPQLAYLQNVIEGYLALEEVYPANRQLPVMLSDGVGVSSNETP